MEGVGAVVGILVGSLALLTGFTKLIIVPMLSRSVETIIATDRGTQAALREKLPELAVVANLQTTLATIADVLDRANDEQAELRTLVHDFMNVIRVELRELSHRVDEEARRNEEHRERNREHTAALALELERVTRIASATVKTAENLSTKIAKDADRHRVGDTVTPTGGS